MLRASWVANLLHGTFDDLLQPLKPPHELLDALRALIGMQTGFTALKLGLTGTENTAFRVAPGTDNRALRSLTEPSQRYRLPHHELEIVYPRLQHLHDPFGRWLSALLCPSCAGSRTARQPLYRAMQRRQPQRWKHTHMYQL